MKSLLVPEVDVSLPVVLGAVRNCDRDTSAMRAHAAEQLNGAPRLMKVLDDLRCR